MAEGHAERLPCPIAGCPRMRPAEHSMCSAHWREVPRELQARVYRTWHARRRRGSGTKERCAHLQALEEAEAAVEGREARELFAGLSDPQIGGNQ